MTEYNKMAQGSFVAASASKFINLPFVPDYVELWNYTNILAGSGTNKSTRAWWFKNFIDTVSSPNSNPTMLELYGSGTTSVFDSIQSNGISGFQAGLMLQYGPLVQHTATTDFAINKANPAQITVSGAGIADHGLQTGDVVIFENLAQTATTGMQQIAGIPFMVTRTGATTFTINWNTNQSNYTAFNTSTSTGNLGSYKKVLYPDLYFPGDIFISNITLGAQTTISTTDQHNFQVGQEVAFRIPKIPGITPPAWGTIELNSLPNVLIPGSPIYGYVVSVTDLQNFVVNINSLGYTAFNSNIPFASYPGLKVPQVVAVGDINSGGMPISVGSQLYPPPAYSYAIYNDTNTINGPAIRGAFVNNTRQGFLIGSGAAKINTSAAFMAAADQVVWHAYLHDINLP